MMFSLLVFLLLSQYSLALDSLQAEQSKSLIILDTGGGHRSTPVPRWRTSIRSVTTSGTNATILAQFGREVNAPTWAEPVYAYSLAYSPSTSFLFSVTGQGIIRTKVDGSGVKTILVDLDGWGEGQITSIAVAEREKKIYFGTQYDGLIKKANFDGTNIEIARNVSQRLQYHTSPSYVSALYFPNGIFVDEEQRFLYWSSIHDGKIQRAPLNDTNDNHFQILVSGANSPRQIRLVQNSLYWNEGPSSSASSIKYLDRYVNQVPALPPPSATPTVPAPLGTPTGTLISSDQSSIFSEDGGGVTLSIQSFVVYRNEVEMKVWLVAQSSAQTMFGKLVEVVWRGSGSGRGPVFEVLNGNTTDVGVPVGLEYIG